MCVVPSPWVACVQTHGACQPWEGGARNAEWYYNDESHSERQLRLTREHSAVAAFHRSLTARPPKQATWETDFYKLLHDQSHSYMNTIITILCTEDPPCLATLDSEFKMWTGAKNDAMMNTCHQIYRV